MPKGNPLSDEQRDKIGRLIDVGLGNEEIAELLGLTDSSVSKHRRILCLVKEDKLEAAEKDALSTKNIPALEWALKRCGKTLPPKKAEPPKNQTEPLFDTVELKKAVAEAISENCKDSKIEQIDPTQMGRIMKALGEITELLEKQNSWFENVCINLELITGNQCAIKAETKENLGQCVNALTGIQKYGIKWNGGTRR